MFRFLWPSFVLRVSHLGRTFARAGVPLVHVAALRVLTMKCATGRREVYSEQIMLQQLLLCVGPSVSR